MNLTLDIDDEIVAKVSRIAEARDMTVAEMVAEYLTGIATSPAASRLERIAKLREAIESAEEKAGILNLNREDCDDVLGPSGIGFDPRNDWRSCLQNDLSARPEVAQTTPTASVSSDLIGAWLPAPSQSCPLNRPARHPTGGRDVGSRRSRQWDCNAGGCRG